MIYIYLLLSGIVDFLITYFCGIVDSWIDIWKPVLIYPALFIAFIVLHLAAFILYSLTSDTKPVNNINNSYRRFMILSLKLYFSLVRVHIHVDGKEKIPDDGKYLFVSNHISVYDPMIEMVVFNDKRLSFISKKENMTIPFAGKYIIKSGCLGLDRDDNRAAVTTINQAAKNITDGVSAIGVYPEGMVNKTGVGLLLFRNGAFKVAKKAKVPIIVATISGTRKINSNLILRRSDITIKVEKVIPYEEISALKTVEIGEKVFEIMSSSLGCGHAQKIDEV